MYQEASCCRYAALASSRSWEAAISCRKSEASVGLVFSAEVGHFLGDLICMVSVQYTQFRTRQLDTEPLPYSLIGNTSYLMQCVSLS